MPLAHGLQTIGITDFHKTYNYTLAKNLLIASEIRRFCLSFIQFYLLLFFDFPFCPIPENFEEVPGTGLGTSSKFSVFYTAWAMKLPILWAASFCISLVTWV